MKRIIWISLVCLFIYNSAFTQQKGEILVTIGNETATRAEFERIYLKNNQMVGETDRKSLEEYFDLFVIYKLKVAEAKALGLQNSNEFKQELAGYRNQLIQPYLIDKKTEENLIREAYERMKYEVNASHILISIPANATPEDTLTIYNKTLRIRDRLVGGEQFEVVARATSDDPSVKRNGGNLGFFSVFQMVYPFENAAFNTKVGDISMPIRTSFGYHIVKVNAKRPNQGQVRAAHIMIATPPNSSREQVTQAKTIIDSLFKLVRNNEDFAELARKHSQDPGSARNGGELPWFGTGRMVPEFEKAAFSLQPGQVSEPMQTQFGWHIVKVLEKKGVGSFEEMLPEIRSRFARDERGRISKTVFVNQLKAKHSFQLDSSALKTMAAILDSSIFTGNWSTPRQHQNRMLFGFAGQLYTLNDLGNTINQNHRQYRNLPYRTIVDRALTSLVEEVVIGFEEKRLVREDEDIYYLMKEYHDGILLFEVMDQNVWSRAVNDSEGLDRFYLDNINQYKWDKRIHTLVYEVKNEKTAKKAHKLANSKRGLKLTTEGFTKRFISKGDTLVSIAELAFLPEDPKVKNFENWANGISPLVKSNNSYHFIRHMRTEIDEPKPLSDIRGQVIADYQEYLEKQWVESLRQKHQVKVNQKVFEEMASSLN